ncbi:hypothetical protein ACX93W_05140 [Paenibacillus sp. CAU 1782]
MSSVNKKRSRNLFSIPNNGEFNKYYPHITSPPSFNIAIEQLTRGYNERAYGSGESGDKMDESTKMMIERLERDSREREERYHNDAREREQRLEKRFERIETLLSSSRQEMRDDIAGLKSDMKSDVAEIKTDFKEMKQDFKDLKKSTDDTNKWIIALAITTILAIVAVAVSVWVK